MTTRPQSTDDASKFYSEWEIACSDGSGTFVIATDGTVSMVNGAPESANSGGPFTIVRGSGEYAELTGSGEWSFTLLGTVWTDIYTGELTGG